MNFEAYLNYLRELVQRPSPFDQPEKVRATLDYCESVLQANLPNHDIFFDEAQNLLAIPQQLELQKPLVYLSAHIDTVGADPDQWEPPFHPWHPFENEAELVARGVNDCKAGVAYQLFASSLVKQGQLPAENLCFAITFKEEGAGQKTGQKIGQALGAKLPLSTAATYFIVLENNVYVGELPKLCVYASERCNYAIKVRGSLPELQDILSRLSAWNPVSIQPVQSIENPEQHTQRGGHICSMSPEENLLRQLILQAAPEDRIQAGDESNFATIPSEIALQKAAGPCEHSLALNKRAFDSMEEVLQELYGIDYEPIKPFSVSQGFHLEEKFASTSLANIIQKCTQPELQIEFMANVGASDGSIVFGSMQPEFKENFYPLVMGPGSRSQRQLNPPRLTHGRNETFHKESGRQAVLFLTRVLQSTLTPNP